MKIEKIKDGLMEEPFKCDDCDELMTLFYNKKGIIEKVHNGSVFPHVKNQIECCRCKAKYKITEIEK